MANHPTMSCLISAKFGWHDSDIAGKESGQQQALKVDSRILAKAGGDIDLYPVQVFTSKIRLRGSGTSISVRYEGEAGKPFKWLGIDTNFITREEK